MPRLTFAQAALAAAFLSPVAASAGTTTQNATFLVVHGIPGRDVAETADPLLPVDVLVAGKYCLLSGFTYGSISGTFSVPPGTYSVAVSLANPLAPCSNAAVISGNVTLTAGEYGAVVAAISTSGAPTAEVFPIDVSPVAAGDTRFVVAHAADAPKVTVKAIARGESASFDLQPGAVASPSVPQPSSVTLSARAGKTVLGPVNVTGIQTQAVVFVAAVGVGSSGTATLLTKIIPSVH
jgi:hypothetical protein